MSTTEPPMPMLCTYVPKPGKEAELEKLLLKHGPMLEKVALRAAKPFALFKSRSKDGKVRFVERFDWISRRAPEIAHQTPEVMAMWEPIGALCDAMDFSVVERIAGTE